MSNTTRYCYLYSFQEYNVNEKLAKFNDLRDNSKFATYLDTNLNEINILKVYYLDADVLSKNELGEDLSMFEGNLDLTNYFEVVFTNSRTYSAFIRNFEDDRPSYFKIENSDDPIIVDYKDITFCDKTTKEELDFFVEELDKIHEKTDEADFNAVLAGMIRKENSCKFHVKNVGHGLFSYLEFDNGDKIVYDIGADLIPNTLYEVEELDFINKDNKNILFISNWNVDHFAEILNKSNIEKFDFVVAPLPEVYVEDGNIILAKPISVIFNYLKDHVTKFYFIRSNDSLNKGQLRMKSYLDFNIFNFELSVFAPVGYYANANKNALSLYIKNQKSVFCTSDLKPYAIQSCLENLELGDNGIDFLLCSHHGSKIGDVKNEIKINDTVVLSRGDRYSINCDSTKGIVGYKNIHCTGYNYNEETKACRYVEKCYTFKPCLVDDSLYTNEEYLKNFLDDEISRANLRNLKREMDGFSLIEDGKLDNEAYDAKFAKVLAKCMKSYKFKLRSTIDKEDLDDKEYFEYFSNYMYKKFGRLKKQMLSYLMDNHLKQEPCCLAEKLCMKGQVDSEFNFEF